MAEVIVVSRFCFEPEKLCYSPLSLFCLAILDNSLWEMLLQPVDYLPLVTHPSFVGRVDEEQSSCKYCLTRLTSTSSYLQLSMQILSGENEINILDHSLYRLALPRQKSTFNDHNFISLRDVYANAFWRTGDHHLSFQWKHLLGWRENHFDVIITIKSSQFTISSR